MLPEPQTKSEEKLSFATWMLSRILPLSNLDFDSQMASLIESWGMLGPDERFVFNKLVTGALRPAVDREHLVGALAMAGNLPPWVVDQRLNRIATSIEFSSLISADISDSNLSRPYELCGAESSPNPLDALEEIGDWHVEAQWDGIRAQLVARGGSCTIWLRSGALARHDFREIYRDAGWISDGTVLDGEIVSWGETGPDSPAWIAKRLQRRSRGKEGDDGPRMTFIVFDILEHLGEDVRELPFRERRALLEQVLPADFTQMNGSLEHPWLVTRTGGLNLSAAIQFSGHSELSVHLNRARALGLKGLILKRLDAEYSASDSWLALKPESLTIDAVVMYVERGAGAQANLCAYVTVGVWKDDGLVPVAKVGANFSEDDAKIVEAFVAANTLERFGPVRTVKPDLVVELAFDGVEPAARRKSGITLRNPRIVGLRGEAGPDGIANLESLVAMMNKA